MRTQFSLLAGLAGLALVGCGKSPTVTCQTQSCGTGTNTSFQACIHKGTAEYDFDGMSCSCPAGDAAACQPCAAMIDAFCAGGTDGGVPTDGSVVDGSATDGGSGCTLTLSGDVTGTFACSVAATETSGNSAFTLTVPNLAPLQSFNFGLQHAGTLTTGTWSNTDTGSTAAAEVQTAGSPVAPTWDMSLGSSATPDTGSYMLNLTSATAGTTGSTTPYDVHGTVDATLTPLAGTGATMNVTLSATF